ncbi:putative phage associated protein [Neisseria meningitidis]|nr:putative phage associated protein [Neisseria meningitidis]
MLPQRAAVAFVLAKVAVNGAVVERDLVVFAQVGAYLFGTEFAADKGVDVLNQLRIELIGLSLTLFDSLALPLGFFGAVLLPLGAVPSDFAADGAFVAVKLFGDFGDGAVAGQVLDVVSFALGQLRVAHGNLSCRKGRMLPHTGLFLLGKVALQMRIRRPLNIAAVPRSRFPPARE